MSFDFDLFVIGGGSGGVRAARTAADTGAKVALAEESRMGGTCVIRGCVPKKLMVFASTYRELPAEAAAYGWNHKAGAFDWPKFRKKLHRELDRLEKVYRNILDAHHVKIYDGRARLADAHTVEMDGGDKVTAKHILVAAGGHPVLPDTAHAGLGIVSDDIFLLEELPKSMLIVGGGYIACEFAGILNGLGVEVTQYYRGAQILRGFDDEARGLVAEAMRERGVDLHLGTNIVEMTAAEAEHGAHPTESDAAMGPPGSEADPLAPETGKPGGPVWVKATNGIERVFDKIFFAIGRKPNTDGLGLEEAGGKLGRRGQIVVGD